MPPEVEGERPAACRQKLVELFHVPLMTKVRSLRFCRRYTRLGRGAGGGLDQGLPTVFLIVVCLPYSCILQGSVRVSGVLVPVRSLN